MHFIFLATFILIFTDLRPCNKNGSYYNHKCTNHASNGISACLSSISIIIILVHNVGRISLWIIIYPISLRKDIRLCIWIRANNLWCYIGIFFFWRWAATWSFGRWFFFFIYSFWCWFILGIVWSIIIIIRWSATPSTISLLY